MASVDFDDRPGDRDLVGKFADLSLIVRAHSLQAGNRGQLFVAHKRRIWAEAFGVVGDGLIVAGKSEGNA